MIDTAIKFDILTDVNQLKELRYKWNTLWKAVDDASSFQSYHYCMNALCIIHNVERSQLACIIGQQDHQLVFIWPFLIKTEAWFRVARPLGPGACEFSSPLVADGHRTVASEAWRYIRRRMAADLIVIDYMKEGSKLYTHIMNDAYKTKPNGSQIAPYARLTGRKLDEYKSEIKSAHFKKHDNLRRRLEKHGCLRFEIIHEGDLRCPELITALLHQKRIWAESVDKYGDWLHRASYENWLKALYTQPSPTENYVAFTLYLNESPIAVKLAAICNNHVDLIIAGFDMNYAKYSPGMRLDEYWVPWCIENKFDIDFGLGDEHYKLFWSVGNFVNTSQCRAPLGLFGKIAVLRHRLRRYLSSLSAGWVVHAP